MVPDRKIPISNSPPKLSWHQRSQKVKPQLRDHEIRDVAPTITSTDGYHDYAQEEDPTEKLNRDYAGHSSLIAHEDETTRSLANQKLPAKLAAMLSDPGEFVCLCILVDLCVLGALVYHCYEDLLCFESAR